MEENGVLQNLNNWGNKQQQKIKFNFKFKKNTCSNSPIILRRSPVLSPMAQNKCSKKL